MKIVYTYYLLTCVALCSIFSSCNNETDIYMENPDKRIQTKMQEYTDDHYQKQKTGSTSFMLSGACQYILHCKRKTMLHTINTLVLCPMIHKGSLDVLHSGNEKHISHKQCQLYKSLHNGHHKLRSSHLATKTGQCIRQKHESRNGYYNRNCYCNI